jgi:hypothetical protein
MSVGQTGNNPIQFFIIYVLAKQPQNQLETEYSHTRKMLKFKQQRKTSIIDAIKVTCQNNSLNNKITVKETF